MANKDLLVRLANAGVIPAGEALRYADYDASRKTTKRRSFSSAQSSNLTYSWVNTAKPIDTDLRAGLRKLRARSRHESQNNDHLRRFLGLVKTNVVGHQGIILQARITDPDDKPDTLANKTIETGWKEWGRKGSCEATGRMSWLMTKCLFIETVARDGEVLIRKLRGTKSNKFRYALQFLDVELLDVEYNDELRNGNVIRMGVELDSFRRPVAYHLLTAKQTADSYVHTGRRYQRIPAEDIIHEFLPEWVWQTRGIPWATSALLRLMMLSGYEEAELVAARVSSSKMGFFEEGDDAKLPGPLAEEVDGDGKLVNTAEPGTFEVLPPGYKFNPWDPQHPTTAYADFVKACLRAVAGGLGVGYNSLANDLEGVNYSSLRQGALDERAVWMALQGWMIESFCDVVYRDWLSMSLMAGALSVGKGKLKQDREEKYQAVTWQPRRWQWVDPLKEMSAHEKSFAHKVTSPQQVIRDRGDDPETVLDEWAQWQQMLDDRNLKIESTPEVDSSLIEDDDNAGTSKNKDTKD